MRKLISENTERVEELRNQAEGQLQKVRAAHALETFVTEAELQTIVAGCYEYNVATMRKDKLTAQMIDRGMDVPTPAELTNREIVLRSAIGCFEFAQLHEGNWRIDTGKLETICDKFRKYITEEWQFERLQFAEKLCEVLNGYTIGQSAQHRNFQDNDFVRFDRKNRKWIPNTGCLWDRDAFKF